MYVPIIKPAKPIKTINKFFIIMNAFDAPDTSLWNVQYSTIAGKMRPRAERHNAPNNDINNSKFGIATASKTGNKMEY